MNPSKPPAFEPDDQYSHRLEEHVRPPHWQNPTPDGPYNLVVIGAGPAGLVAAAGAAGLGAKVALVERQLLGGDCLNYGCVPSKAVLRAARAWADRRRDSRFGLAEAPVEGDFGAVMARMRRLRADMSRHDAATRFRELGVDVHLGTARFVDDRTVEVEGRRLRFARACIATGARPALPAIDGLASEDLLTNETVFSLTELPERLTVLGGGPIGCELAQAFARFGAQVTLVQRGGRLLPRDDEDASRLVLDRLVADGVRVCCDAQIVAGARRSNSTTLDLTLRFQDGRTETLVADRCLAATGRQANVEALELERAGVAVGAGGVRVDDFLRTTNRRVYAAGDVCSTFQFTHAADAQARLVIQNALFFGRARASRLVVPWCTYVDPEVAQVGWTAAEAERRGVRATSIVVPFSQVDRAVLDDEAEGFLKVVVAAGGDRILGGSVVARHAGDLLAPLALAMSQGIRLGRIAGTILPYPTQAEALKKAADACRRTRLTPAVRRWFERLMRWRR